MMAFRRYTLTILFLFIYQYAGAQDKETVFITLKPQHNFYNLKHMHITAVIDDRTDTSIIGYVNTGFMQRRTPVSLSSGLSTIQAYISANTKQDMNTPGFEMHISQLELSQQSLGMKKQLDIQLLAEFYLHGEKLITVPINSYQQYNDNVLARAEQLLRQSIEHTLRQSDNLIAQNSNTILSSPKVNVVVEIDKPTDENDIIYSRNRPLTFDDFQGKPDKFMNAVALTYSANGLRASSQHLHSVTTLKVFVMPFFSKKGSWYKKDKSSLAVLKHEQMHFDITAINSCELINAIKAFSFSPDNYEQELRELQKKYVDKCTDMQNQYDEETHHGTLTTKQQQWEKRIADKLAEQNCF